MGEIEVLKVIFDFLQQITGVGWEETNRLISYVIVIVLVLMLLRGIFWAFFGWSWKGNKK